MLSGWRVGGRDTQVDISFGRSRDKNALWFFWAIGCPLQISTPISSLRYQFLDSACFDEIDRADCLLPSPLNS